jgi:hypothetical protein
VAEAGVGFVDIIPRTERFVSSLTGQIQSATSKVQSQTSSSFLGLTKGVQAGFLALGVVAVTAISKGIQATQEWAGQVRALQKVTGQTAESASTFAAAAQLLGIGVDRLQVSFGILGKNIVTNNKALTDYGIITRDAQGQVLPFDDVLGNVIDKFGELPKGIEQAAFAQRVFGRSGRDLIPILAKGRQGLTELRGEAEKLGLVLSQKDLDASKALSLAQRELGLAIHGAAVQLGKEFIPFATKAVEVLTAVVEIVDKIPSPVLAGVAAFAALTGAVAGVNLVGGFVVDTWTTVLKTFGFVADSADAVVNANEALAQSATDVVSNVADVAVVADSATDATAKLATSSTAAATGATLFGASLETILGIAAPVAVGIGLIVAAVIVLRKDAAAAHAAFQAGLNRDLEQLKSGGRAAAEIRRLARQPVLQQTLTIGAGRGLAVDRELLNQKTATLEAQAALAEYRRQQALAATSTDALARSTRQLLKPVEDLTTPISQITNLTDTLNESVGRLGPSFGHLSAVSGQDFRSIGADVAKALADPKTTVEQLPGIFSSALGSVRATMRKWHDDVVATFGGAAGAIQEFLGQAAGSGPNRVSFKNLTDSLATTQTQLHRFKREFDALKGDPAAKSFLQEAKNSGLDFLGVLDAVSGKPKKVQQEFFHQWNEVNKDTNNLATDITDAFGKAADRIVNKLKELINAVLGNPIKPKVDTSEADRKIGDLKNALDTLAVHKTITIDVNRTGGGGGKVLTARGGIIHGAEGFITQGPVFQIGEGSASTFAGKGAEGVIPFNERGIGILAEALSRAGGSTRHIHVTVGFDDSGNLEVRRIARDEIDREHDFRARVG